MLRLTTFLYSEIYFSIDGDDLNGRLNSNACAAFINSIAKTRSTFSTTHNNFVAAFAPILTWSSCPFDETIESTDAGVHNCLFSLTIDAAVYCGIINPEFNPGFSTKKAGNPR